eukprot:TRINITY_DN107556_c0_g1_i1.p1 TRINITY_DN107556_c0_g1~~TRINITY_DN107556_c0_g1_i1.p1  ORF type:complete len:538 (+),score=118.67 TRINITY_DN107556_c0_g1_i1:209-1615(+)
MGEHGKWRDVLALHSERIAAAASPECRATLFSHSVAALAAAGQWERSLELFQELRCEAGSPTKIWGEDLDLCKGVTASYIATGRWQQLLRLLTEVRHAGVLSTEAHAVGMDGLAKASQWQVALTVFDDVQSSAMLDSSVYVAKMRAWGSGRHWQEALQLLSEMCTKRLTLDEQAYSGAIDACMRAALEESEASSAALAARHLLREMREQKLIPTSFSYNRAISACARAQKAHWALQLLTEMTTENPALWPKGPLKPSVALLNSCLGACSRSACWQEAMTLLEGMAAPDENSFRVAASSCSWGGHWQMALEIASKMQSHGFKLSRSVCSSLVSACSKAGQWQQTLYVLSMMRSDTALAPGACQYNEAMTVCKQDNQWQRALWILREMPAAAVMPDVVSYGAAIFACDRARQWTIALELHEEMLLRKLKPNLITFTLAVGACRKKLQEILLAARQGRRASSKEAQRTKLL